MARPVSEFEIQRALCLWLDGHKNAPPALRPEVIYFHPANGGVRSGVEGKQFKQIGVKRGIFDLCFLGFQRFWVLEMKAQAGTLSADQLAMWKRYEAAGASGIAVANSLESAKKIIREWGLVTC